MNKQENTLKKVRGLLAKASGTKFPAEAETFRQKADELMTAYAIEEWRLEEDDGKPEPVRLNMNVDWYYDMADAVSSELWQMFSRVAQHCRCKVVWWSGAHREVPIMGLPADTKYFDLLFTSLMMQMVAELEPQPDPELPRYKNVRHMKEAGMNWERIGELLINAGQLDSYSRSKAIKLYDEYKKFCRENGIEQVKVMPATYQRSFSRGFVSALTARLSKQTEKRQQGDSSGTELVLRDIRVIVSEAAEEMFR